MNPVSEHAIKHSFKLEVESVPEWVAEPKDVAARVGGEAVFECKAEGRPAPKIQWFMNGIPLEDWKDDSCRIVTNGQLQFLNLGQEDAKRIQCNASNHHGYLLGDVALNIMAPPDQPTDVTTSACMSRSANVTWTEGFNNFSPITTFYVEYNHSFAPNFWNKGAIVTDPSKTEAKVWLSPYARYTFRVIAENEIGRSMPSDPSVNACATESDRPEKHPTNVHTDISKTGWLIVKWDRMEEIEHNGPGFRYNLIIKEDGRTIKTEIYDWTVNKQEIYMGTVYEPYEIHVEAENEKGPCPYRTVMHIGHSGEAAPLITPDNFELVDIMSAYEATFQWDAVDTSPEKIRGVFKGYKIRYWKTGQKNTSMTVIEVPRTPARDTRIKKRAITETVTVNSLPPFSDLEADIVTANTYFISDPSNVVSFRTPEGVPGPVKNAQVVVSGAHHFQIQWEPPEEPNGMLLGYDIGYRKVNGSNIGEVLRTDRYDDPQLSQALIGNLEENQPYMVYVWARTIKGRGEDYFLDAKTAHAGSHQISSYASISTPTTTQCDAKTCQNNTSKPVMYDLIRLPQSLWPKLYNITIQPFIYDVDPMEFSFACEAIIHMDCKESTDLILIHSVGHNISFISIENETGTIELVHWWHNDDLEMLQIKSKYMLTEGEEYVLTIQSVSSMSENLRGFYYSPYREGNQTKYIFTTMMEPTDARRVFPCFDEPDFKAVFIFNIIRKEGLTSLTNLPRRLTLGPDAEGYYTDIFDEPRNVPMSTYLVAIAIGDLDNLASTVNNVSFRTWCRSREVNKTKYALEIGMKFMEFFEDYFQIPYSLPKEDMIAVPTMSFAGMEHWGLITYRENMLFYEEGVSSLNDKETMTIIIAHEVAHQWFGNLVSPFWWDDLWLNEGFATYMMFLAVDRVLPSWNMVNKQIVETRGLQNVMQADDDNNTHPVYVDVYNPDDIANIFDLISYAKGGAVIRMMNFFLGEDTFRKGLTRYLKDFSYKTATHKDLWSSLSQQAVVDNHTFTDVTAVMDTWVLEENYPVVKMSLIDDHTIQLTQSAFLETAEQRKDRSHVTWKIPFVYTTDIERNFNKTYADITWISNKTAYIKVSDTSLRNASWIIGNIQQYGFYRVNYDEHNWNALLDQLIANHTIIHVINRAQIINDAWNLARAGLLDIQIALKTLDYLDKELDFVPWKAALRELKYVKTSLQLTALYGLFEHFMRGRLRKAYFSTAVARDHYNRLQYSMISNIACEYDLEECIDDAMDKFNAWKNDNNVSMDPELKEMVYCIGVKHGGQEAWAYVLRNFIDSESTSEKQFLLDALTCSTQPWLLMTLSEMMFSTDVFSKTEKVSVLARLSGTPTGRLLAWNILEDNWKSIQDEFGEDINLFSVIISAVTHSINTPAELNRLRGFLRQQKNLGRAKAMFETAIDKAETNIKWKDKYYDTIKAWLSN
ncbi:aminopeptidase Ey-like isoform X2 [Mercenaria mercenaria]|uniref:aminopeptidase Ey-like isoform X2 n=1 Tax=Mercenaria mercenaria TaxID=6596 RepID=UPI00234F65F3|nr:aminopeptidase Ey-like isoform X2 [Mercenaria mercenaria]